MAALDVAVVAVVLAAAVVVFAAADIVNLVAVAMAHVIFLSLFFVVVDVVIVGNLVSTCVVVGSLELSLSCYRE